MIKNRTTIKVKGLNQERALNNISKKVKIFNFKREDEKNSQFEVELKDTKEIKKLIENQGLEIVSISHRGFFYNLKKALLRYGIIAGIIISLIFYLVQFNLVLKIEVWGGESAECQEVKSFVKDNMNSNFKSNISTDNLEIMIRNNFDFVSSVSVAIVGQSLIINLNPAVLPDEMGDDFQPIVSEYDGMITEINLIQGTLYVNEGDIVQKGDVLVLPYTTDADGTVYQVQPKAEIYANVWISASTTHYDYRIESTRTGNLFTNVEVLLGDLVIYSNTHDVSYEEYEVENYTEDLTKNLILPLKLRKTTYYEIETNEIISNFEDVKEDKIAEARQKALIFLQENDIIINENYYISEGAGCHIVSYTITTSKNIGG